MHIRNALHRSTYFCIWSVFHFLLHYSSFTSNFGSKVDNENLHIRSVRLVSGLERYNNMGQLEGNELEWPESQWILSGLYSVQMECQ